MCVYCVFCMCVCNVYCIAYIRFSLLERLIVMSKLYLTKFTYREIRTKGKYTAQHTDTHRCYFGFFYCCRCFVWIQWYRINIKSGQIIIHCMSMSFIACYQLFQSHLCRKNKQHREKTQWEKKRKNWSTNVYELKRLLTTFKNHYEIINLLKIWRSSVK